MDIYLRLKVTVLKCLYKHVSGSIEEDVTPEQRDLIEETQRENYSCLVAGLIDAGFGYVTGGGGGSLTAFLSNIATCRL